MLRWRMLCLPSQRWSLSSVLCQVRLTVAASIGEEKCEPSCFPSHKKTDRERLAEFQLRFHFLHLREVLKMARFSISARRKAATTLLLLSLCGQAVLAAGTPCAFASGYAAGAYCRGKYSDPYAIQGCCDGACRACHPSDGLYETCYNKCAP